MNRQRFAFQKWKTLVSSLPFQKNRQSKPEASVVATEPDNKPEKKCCSWLAEGLQIAIITVAGSVIVAFLSNPDKIKDWITLLFPDPVSFDCEGITMKIPRNWHADGQNKKCQAIAYGLDATITPKSFKNEINSPKLIVIVEEIYEQDINLKKFYEREKEQAEILIGMKNTESRANPDFTFKSHNAYELVYSYQGGKFKRKDIGFLDRRKQYTIRYEASTIDFEKYEKEAGEIINSLAFNSEKDAK